SIFALRESGSCLASPSFHSAEIASCAAFSLSSKKRLLVTMVAFTDSGGRCPKWVTPLSSFHEYTAGLVLLACAKGKVANTKLKISKVERIKLILRVPLDLSWPHYRPKPLGIKPSR